MKIRGLIWENGFAVINMMGDEEYLRTLQARLRQGSLVPLVSILMALRDMASKLAAWDTLMCDGLSATLFDTPDDCGPSQPPDFCDTCNRELINSINHLLQIRLLIILGNISTKFIFLKLQQDNSAFLEFLLHFVVREKNF